ncbi:hypothetical protein [Ligilactobacillus ruminis]|nr:hypothetical protein [Ligilactobacillus ruminis]
MRVSLADASDAAFGKIIAVYGQNSKITVLTVLCQKGLMPKF